MSRNRKLPKNVIYIPNQECYQRDRFFFNDTPFKNMSNFRKKQEQLKKNKK